MALQQRPSPRNGAFTSGTYMSAHAVGREVGSHTAPHRVRRGKRVKLYVLRYMGASAHLTIYGNAIAHGHGHKMKCHIVVTRQRPGATWT